MSLSYFPMYPSDFEAGTSHLNLEEDGAYNRILRIMWLTPGCSFPNDPELLARRLRVDAVTYNRVIAPLIKEFFKIENGRIFNQRLQNEYVKAQESYHRRSEAGKKGGKSQAIENKGNDIKHCLSIASQPEPEPYNKKEIAIAISKKDEIDEIEIPSKAKKTARRNDGTRLPDAWRPDETLIAFAASRNFTGGDLGDEIELFKNYWTAKAGKDACRLDWDATFRNWLIEAGKRRGRFQPRRLDEGPPKKSGKQNLLDALDRLAACEPEEIISRVKTLIGLVKTRNYTPQEADCEVLIRVHGLKPQPIWAIDAVLDEIAGGRADWLADGWLPEPVVFAGKIRERVIAAKAVERRKQVAEAERLKRLDEQRRAEQRKAGQTVTLKKFDEFKASLARSVAEDSLQAIARNHH